MLPGINRLKNKKDFDRVFKQGKGLKLSFLTFRLAKNNLAATRFGFVVGLKVSKKATVRNRIKRKLREAAQTALKKISQHFDIVVLASSGAQDKSLVEIQELFQEFLNKGRLSDG